MATKNIKDDFDQEPVTAESLMGGGPSAASQLEPGTTSEQTEQEAPSDGPIGTDLDATTSGEEGNQEESGSSGISAGDAIDAARDISRLARTAGQAGNTAGTLGTGAGAAGAGAGAAGAAAGAGAAGTTAAAGTAAAGTAAAGTATVAIWPIILGIIAAVIAIITLVIVIAIVRYYYLKDQKPNATQTPTTTVNEGLCQPLPNPDPNSSVGFARLPSSPNYSIVSNEGYWGTPELVAALQGVASVWHSKYPKVTIGYNDLSLINGGYYSPHASHQKGIDVDINSNNGTQNFIMTKPNYSQKLAIELAQLYFDTGAIEYIFYNDPAVIAVVNAYAQTNGRPGVMKQWPGHDNHFHLRITPGSYSKICGGS